MDTTRKGWLDYGARFLVSLTVLILVMRSVSWPRIAELLAAADPLRLTLAGLLTVPIIVLKGLKWGLLLQHAGIRTPLRRTALSYMAGLGFGLLTPGRVGELARIWVLGLDRKAVLPAGALILLDRITDLIALLLLLAVTILHFFGGTAFAIYGAFGIVTALVLARLSHRLRQANTGLAQPRPFLAKVLSALASVHPGHLAGYVGLGLIVTIFGITMVFLFLSAIHPVSFGACLIALPPVFMNSILPVTVGGIGVRELLMTFVCGRLGIPTAAALSAILLYFIAGMLIPGAVGLALFALTRPGRHPREPVPGTEACAIPRRAPETVNAGNPTNPDNRKELPC